MSLKCLVRVHTGRWSLLETVSMNQEFAKQSHSGDIASPSSENKHLALLSASVVECLLQAILP